MPPKRKIVEKAKGVSKKKIHIKNEPNDGDKQNKSSKWSRYCKVCQSRFNTRVLYRQHLIRCLQKNPLTLVETIEKGIFQETINCKECKKKFRFQNSYRAHVLKEHSKLAGGVSCGQCPVRCPDKATLKQHIADVHEREIFECPHCTKKFVRHSHVLRHLQQTGCDGGGVTLFPCEICNSKFSRKDNLMVHLRYQHITQKAFKCKKCAYSTATFSKLVIHHKEKHLEKNHYECHHCGKATSSRAAMSKHLEIHGDKKFACEVCGYSTFTLEVMRRHVLTHVPDKPYKCEQCDSSFIQRIQLQRHLEKHSSLLCKECNASFTVKAEFNRHLKEHPNKIACAVGTCSKQFTDKERLHQHLERHHAPKAFPCEICHKNFHTEILMRRHVLSHTLERPRRCMYCVTARAYARGMQLVRHVRKNHPTVFQEHLCHVRQVLGHKTTVQRVKKSELDSILNVLDAEAERILQGYGEGVLYGGMQEADEVDPAGELVLLKSEVSPLMTEEELAENLNKLLSQMIDKDTLECFGWPEETVDTVLEKVIEQCGARPADRDKWTRVQCLRENAKHLFLYVLEDKNIARMLDTHTIDQIVKHILDQVSDADVK